MVCRTCGAYPLKHVPLFGDGCDNDGLRRFCPQHLSISAVRRRLDFGPLPEPAVLTIFTARLATPADDLRWIVRVVYRGDLGLIDNEFHVEEIAEVHAIVEGGPDWNCIERIEIVLNPKRAYACTIEQSLER